MLPEPEARSVFGDCEGGMSLRSPFSDRRLPSSRRLSPEQKLRFLKAATPQKYAKVLFFIERAYAEALQPYLVNGKRDEVS